MRLSVVCLVLIVTLAGCGSTTSSDTTTTYGTIENNERTTGNPEVYARIASLTSCTALQREFDIAMDNAEARESGDPYRDLSLSYANAANTRMQEIGCYG